MRIRADLHSHAIGDGQFGYLPVEDLVKRHVDAALEAGLDCLAVTDHDELRTGLMAVEYVERQQLPILVLAGMEVSTADGHLVVIGIDSPIEQGRGFDATLAEARQRNALCLLPHPFFEALRRRGDVDGIETMNARYGSFEIPIDTVPVLANSDAHSPDDLKSSPCHNIVDVPELTFRGIVEALCKRRVSVKNDKLR